MIKIFLLFVCIAAAFSLPYPDHHENHGDERAKVLPSDLSELEQKSEPKEKLTPRLVPLGPNQKPDQFNPEGKNLEKSEDGKDKSDLERSEFFWGGWHSPYYYRSYYYPTYYYRSYWW